MNKITLCLALLLFNTAQADELNQRNHVAPSVAAKTNNLIARAYAQDGPKQDKVIYNNAGQAANQNVEIGTTHNATNPPGEQNTVVNGSVTVICRNCYGKP
jgi:hypothetical protein